MDNHIPLTTDNLNRLTSGTTRAGVRDLAGNILCISGVGLREHPPGSLPPRWTVGEALTQPWSILTRGDKGELRQRSVQRPAALLFGNARLGVGYRLGSLPPGATLTAVFSHERLQEDRLGTDTQGVAEVQHESDQESFSMPSTPPTPHSAVRWHAE